MELLVLLAAAAVTWWWLIKPKAKPPAATTYRQSSDAPPEVVPQIHVTITSSTSPLRRGTETPPSVGELTPTGPNQWILNPQSPLPLTVEGPDKGVAQQVKSILDNRAHQLLAIPELTLMIAKYNLRFEEVDRLVRDLKPKFDTQMRRRIANSAEWADASEKDREDLRAEFEEEVMDSLGIHTGQADLAILLEGPPTELEIDDELLRRFDGDLELYPFYLTQLSRANTVVTVKADDWWRKSWEGLAAKGFALRGKDIPVAELLEGLRLKDLNELLEGVVAKPLGRRAKAIEALMALPDLQERLAQKLSFRELFKAVPPENVDLAQLQACFQYATEVAQIVQQTYATGLRTVSALEERKRNDGGYDAWEILHWEDPIPACAKPYCKKYLRTPPKRPPFHVGCTCQLENTFKDL